MALDFPTSPALNEIYTYGGRSWQWNGTAWDVYNANSGNVVTQLNGLTGGVTLAGGSNITLTPFGNTITIGSSGGISGPYVVSILGLTGAVGITNGSGINLSVSGNTLTISNAGVLSFNGFTGAVQGVSAALGTTYLSVSSATGSVTFTNLGVQTFNGLTGTVTGVTLGGAAFTGLVSSTVGFSGPGTNITGVVTSFNNQTGAVTGVTVGGTNVFTALNTFNAGISASGITVGGSIVLQNQEFIRNTTDGRIDFMPGPVSGTTYGLYMHFTNWGAGLNGVQFGTITSNTPNTLDGAAILYGSSLVLANTKQFSFGSSQRYSFSQQSSTNSTLQLAVPSGVANESAAVSIMDYAWLGNANRIPATAHTNPNLYIYRAGNSNANDFVRFEHDGTNGRIVSGGTSGISIEPGSGVLGVSGSISAAGATFSGLIRANAGISAAGATFSGTINLNGQTFTNIVSAINGLTGIVGLSAGSNITITPSGNTLTISSSGGGAVSSVSGTGSGILVSPTTGAVIVQNTGVQNINGLTGAVTAVTSIEGLTGDVVISAIDLYYFNIGII